MLSGPRGVVEAAVVVVAGGGQGAGAVRRQGWDESREPVRVLRAGEHAALSLLPEVRVSALELFVSWGCWHGSVAGGPSNHLLSSQVQCVNALGQMVNDPARLARAFGPLLGTREVLEIEPGRFLTFEYIGDEDFFGEGGGRWPGARFEVHERRCRLLASDGGRCRRVGLGGVEVHRVVSSRDRSSRQPMPFGGPLRRRADAPDGPVRGDLVPFDELLQEPLYQLMRQQLLAWELEKARAHGADRVRVVLVSPIGQRAVSAGHCTVRVVRSLGGRVSEVWSVVAAPQRPVRVDGQQPVRRPCRDVRRVRVPLRRGRERGGVTEALSAAARLGSAVADRPRCRSVVVDQRHRRGVVDRPRRVADGLARTGHDGGRRRC